MPDPLHVIRWQRPPKSKTPHEHRPRPSQYDVVAAELRDNQGVWGVIFEGDPGRAAGLSSHIRNGTLACFRPAGAFEAVSRMDCGKRVVFARYVGGESDA